MSHILISEDNIDLDLSVGRHFEAPPALVWRVMTEPELIKTWFCPRPWHTVDCRLELRLGGEFFTTMQGPEEQSFSGSSCVLEAIPNERFVWTSALLPGFRPAPSVSEDDKACSEIVFTCITTLTAVNGGTDYLSRLLHKSPEATKAHNDMGFHQGWGACLEQMAETLQLLIKHP